MRIDASGKVGIGRTNPLSPLDIKARKGILTATSLQNLYSNASVMITGHAEHADALCIGMLSTDTVGNSGNNPYAYIQNVWDQTVNILAQPLLLNPGGGNIAIGKTIPGARLDVNGNVRCTSLTETSDDRIKYNEADISTPLDLINQLNPQKYEKIMEFPHNAESEWIPTDEEWENVKENYKYGDEFGFIAQDIKKIPELSFLVHGEETRTDTKTSAPEEYSNLTTDEQSTYTTSYVYESNTITQEEYSNITPEEQGLYSTQYTKQIETQTPLALNYQGLFVVAIGAIQELKAKNDALEARITALESA